MTPVPPLPESAEAEGTPVSWAFTGAVPEAGKPVQVVPGIWWIRLPLESLLDHVNVYALDEGNAWTLVDTGSKSVACEEGLKAVFESGPLSGKSIRRLIVTHHHPDHIGLAGPLAARGASLWTTRTSWLSSRLLQGQGGEKAEPEMVAFFGRAGLTGIELAAFARRPHNSYARQVAPLPASYRRIRGGDRIHSADREWTVRIGHGHSAEHALLVSDDGVAIVGDQILTGTTSSLAVHFSEPEADPAGEWLDSCRELGPLLGDQTLCLPGHNLPFRGAATRCRQLAANVERALQRAVEFLKRPATATGCLEAVYRRSVSGSERPLRIAETVGFLNHLLSAGLVERLPQPDQPDLWQRTPAAIAWLSGVNSRETNPVLPL